MSESKELATRQESSLSVRFMNKVMTEFTSGVGEVALTKFQKRLAQNYFIAVNSTLQKAELKRLKKEEKYRDPIPVTWANVNMEGLAQDVVACARIGTISESRRSRTIPRINMILFLLRDTVAWNSKRKSTA
jgi:recombination protein RecT